MFLKRADYKDLMRVIDEYTFLLEKNSDLERDQIDATHERQEAQRIGIYLQKVITERDELQALLHEREKEKNETLTISKDELIFILKQYYNFEGVTINYLAIRDPLSNGTVYQSNEPWFDISFQYIRKTTEKKVEIKK
jgi:hypothetical protein